MKFEFDRDPKYGDTRRVQRLVVEAHDAQDERFLFEWMDKLRTFGRIIVEDADGQVASIKVLSHEDKID